MSSPGKENELKAGHAPAVKAGGMRIKAARVHEEKLSKEETESPWEEPVKEVPQTVVVSGVVLQGDKEHSPAASKVAHVKPVPTAIKPVQNKQINRIIQQPR